MDVSDEELEHRARAIDPAWGDRPPSYRANVLQFLTTPPPSPDEARYLARILRTSPTWRTGRTGAAAAA